LSQDSEIDELVRVNLAAADRRSGMAKRGQHPKHHGCVRATFTVGDWLPEDVRFGLFGEPRDFPAFIRFSNGRAWDDRQPDVHGMAVKLLDAPGAKVIPAHEHEMAADFVLVDSEAFFAAELAEYGMFTAGFLKSRRQPWYGPFFWTKMVLLYPGLLAKAREFASGRPASPLEVSYFSATPYKLGPHAVKYVARPRVLNPRKGPVGKRNGLARALADTLCVQDVIFDFGVDIQTNSQLQPIEDPRTPWSTVAQARREWLGALTISSQIVDPTSTLAEDLSFSPWHTTEDHRPLGRINAARAPVYQEMATLRHELNGVFPPGTSEVPTRQERE
jgi:hypothetical protein